eukprot:gene9906-20603_t
MGTSTLNVPVTDITDIHLTSFDGKEYFAVAVSSNRCYIFNVGRNSLTEIACVDLSTHFLTIIKVIGCSCRCKSIYLEAVLSDEQKAIVVIHTEELSSQSQCCAFLLADIGLDFSPSGWLLMELDNTLTPLVLVAYSMQGCFCRAGRLGTSSPFRSLNGTDRVRDGGCVNVRPFGIRSSLIFVTCESGCVYVGDAIHGCVLWRIKLSPGAVAMAPVSLDINTNENQNNNDRNEDGSCTRSGNNSYNNHNNNIIISNGPGCCSPAVTNDECAKTNNANVYYRKMCSVLMISRQQSRPASTYPHPASSSSCSGSMSVIGEWKHVLLRSVNGNTLPSLLLVCASRPRVLIEQNFPIDQGLTVSLDVSPVEVWTGTRTVLIHSFSFSNCVVMVRAGEDMWNDVDVVVDLPADYSPHGMSMPLVDGGDPAIADIVIAAMSQVSGAGARAAVLILWTNTITTTTTSTKGNKDIVVFSPLSGVIASKYCVKVLSHSLCQESNDSSTIMMISSGMDRRMKSFYSSFPLVHTKFSGRTNYKHMIIFLVATSNDSSTIMMISSGMGGRRVFIRLFLSSTRNSV